MAKKIISKRGREEAEAHKEELDTLDHITIDMSDLYGANDTKQKDFDPDDLIYHEDWVIQGARRLGAWVALRHETQTYEIWVGNDLLQEYSVFCFQSQPLATLIDICNTIDTYNQAK